MSFSHGYGYVMGYGFIRRHDLQYTRIKSYYIWRDGKKEVTAIYEPNNIREKQKQRKHQSKIPIENGKESTISAQEIVISIVTRRLPMTNLQQILIPLSLMPTKTSSASEQYQIEFLRTHFQWVKCVLWEKSIKTES